jgi:hypothetical protein
MANGLKGKAIAYTAVGTRIITLSGCTKIFLRAKSAGMKVWTASQEAAGNVNGQADYKQTWDTDVPFEFDAVSKQMNSDFFEDIMVELETGVKLHGFIWGQGAQWVVDEDEEE